MLILIWTHQRDSTAHFTSLAEKIYALLVGLPSTFYCAIPKSMIFLDKNYIFQLRNFWVIFFISACEYIVAIEVYIYERLIAHHFLSILARRGGIFSSLTFGKAPSAGLFNLFTRVSLSHSFQACVDGIILLLAFLAHFNEVQIARQPHSKEKKKKNGIGLLFTHFQTFYTLMYI